MTTVDLTASDVGAKIILTDKLVRQSAENVFSMIGRQLGDGMARKKDTDVIALWPSLNGGTVLGADGRNMNVANTHAVISLRVSVDSTIYRSVRNRINPIVRDSVDFIFVRFMNALPNSNLFFSLWIFVNIFWHLSLLY